jgi:DNA polymerase III subunit epsilon
MTICAGVDLETSGNDISKERIVEIAVIAYELETWTEKFRYVRRFNPQMKINPKAFAVHGIADADVMNEPTLDKAAPIIGLMFSKIDLFVGHNIIGFDFPLLVQDLNRVGGRLLRNPDVVDTISARWATADGKLPTLGEVCWALDVPYDPEQAHGASYDAQVSLNAFKRGLDLGWFELPAKLTMKEAA